MGEPDDKCEMPWKWALRRYVLALEARTRRLEEALKFYADPERYKMDPDSGFIRIQYDGGEVARLILASPDLGRGAMGDPLARYRKFIREAEDDPAYWKGALEAADLTIADLRAQVDDYHRCIQALPVVGEKLRPAEARAQRLEEIAEVARCYFDQLGAFNRLDHPEVHKQRLRLRDVLYKYDTEQLNPPSLEPGLVEGHSGNVERRSMRGTLTSEALSGDAVPPGTSLKRCSG